MSFHAGFVGLIGMPNAGKSTLVNVLVGQKVSIVTPKPQTTRKRLLGIVSEPEYQAVFVDAPGVTRSTSGLNEFLQHEIASVAEESDVLLAILNLDEKHPAPLVQVLEFVRERGKPWAAVITKSDLATETRVGFLKAALLNDNVPVLMVSAIENPTDTRKQVLEIVEKLLPENDSPLFDPEITTTSQLREMAAEVVREKCFLELGEEIPYGLGVKIQEFREEDRITRITADIVVDKSSHKPMVIGQGGHKIKSIGTNARLDLEQMLETKVFLELFVAVKEKWTRHPSLLKEMGYAQE